MSVGCRPKFLDEPAIKADLNVPPEPVLQEDEVHSSFQNFVIQVSRHVSTLQCAIVKEHENQLYSILETNRQLVNQINQLQSENKFLRELSDKKRVGVDGRDTERHTSFQQSDRELAWDCPDNQDSPPIRDVQTWERLASPDFICKQRYQIFDFHEGTFYAGKLSTCTTLRFKEAESARTHLCISAPDSLVCAFWDVLGMFVIAIEAVTIPLSIAFGIDRAQSVRYLDFSTCFYWLVDLPFNFCRGYTEVLTEQIIMSPRRIAKQYILSWFVPDLIILTVDVLSLAFSTVQAIDVAALLRTGKVLRVLRVLRVIRTVYLFKYTSRVQLLIDLAHSEYFSAGTDIGINLALILLLNHFIACAWFYLGDSATGWVSAEGMHDRTTVYKYLTSVHFALTQFTPSSMSVQPVTSWERLFAVFTILVALCVFSSFISRITSRMAALRARTAHKDLQKRHVRKYLVWHNISPKLALRIKRHLFEVIPKKQNESDMNSSRILEELSVPLQSELRYELFHNKLVVCPFFEELQKQSLAFGRMICEVALTEFALSACDVLFNRGMRATAMYVLTRGEMLYTYIDSELPFPKRGYCSEPALWTNWVHVGSMKAVEDSQGVSIGADGFRSVVLAFPAIHDTAWSYGSAIVSKLNAGSSCSMVPLRSYDLSDLCF